MPAPSDKYVPTRTCVACRKKAAKNTLFRVAFLGGTPAVDLSQTANSRSIYICRDKKCLERAQKNKNNAKFLTADVVTKLTNILESEIEQ